MSRVLTSDSQFPNLVDCREIALDLETTGLDPLSKQIRLVSLNTGTETLVVDCFKAGYRFLEFLNDFQGLLIGHNIKFDCRFLQQLGVVPLKARIFDTFRASHALHNGMPDVSHTLDQVLDREGFEYKSEDYGGSDWSGELSENQLKYSAEDVRLLPQLASKLRVQLVKEGLARACKLDCDAILAEVLMENSGFSLDTEKWRALARENSLKADTLAEELLTQLPAPTDQLAFPGIQPGWNLNSRLKVMDSFRRLGIDLDNTRRNTLLLGPSNPLLDKFLEYRKYDKASTAFGEEYLQYLHPRTGRIHSSYWPFTGAGRYSSSNPNLQQLPRLEAFRECFIPRPGYKLLICDYSQIELRIMAEISGDRTLRDVFRKGIDAHTATASIISNTPLDKVSKDSRQKAKPVNFGLMYGMGSEKLAVYSKTEYRTEMSPEEAETFRTRYFQAYRGVQQWHRDTTRAGARTGESRTMSGRRRWLEKDCYSEFLNTPVQGTGADGMKAAMAMFTATVTGRYPVNLINVVHDEMVVECREDSVDVVKPMLEKSMVAGMSQFVKSVPVLADVSVGDTWADK